MVHLSGAATMFSPSDVQSLSWERRTDVNGPGRHHPAVFANETHAFMVTGSIEREGWFFDEAEASSIMHVYEEESDTWTVSSKGRFPGRPRTLGYGLDLPVLGDSRAFVGFGAALDDGTRLSDWWSFDMSTHEWKELAPCPGSGRRHPAMVAVRATAAASPLTDDDASSPLSASEGWQIHVGLGDGIVNGDFSNLRDWWSYDVDRDTWTALDDFPSTPRHHPFFFGIGSTAYVGLGHSPSGIERDWYGYHAAASDRPAEEGWVRSADFASFDVNDMPSLGFLRGNRADPVTTEARVAGTEFSIQLPLLGEKTANSEDSAAVASSSDGSTTKLSGSIGFVLSGDGKTHRTMANGEFHAFIPPSGDEEGGGGEWIRLPSHPGVSRWAPGSFVMRGTARAYFTSGYERTTRTMYSDLWLIDLSPLFATATSTTHDQQEYQTIANGEFHSYIPSSEYEQKLQMPLLEQPPSPSTDETTLSSSATATTSNSCRAFGTAVTCVVATTIFCGVTLLLSSQLL